MTASRSVLTFVPSSDRIPPQGPVPTGLVLLFQLIAEAGQNGEGIKASHQFRRMTEGPTSIANPGMSQS